MVRSRDEWRERLRGVLQGLEGVVARRELCGDGASVRQRRDAEGRLLGLLWAGMAGHTVVCVKGVSVFVIYTGSGRPLDGA